MEKEERSRGFSRYIYNKEWRCKHKSKAATRSWKRRLHGKVKRRDKRDKRKRTERKELTRKRSSKVGHGVGRRRRLLFVFAHGDGEGT
jgi:hypothetical protein